MPILAYFRNPLLVTVVGLTASFIIGWRGGHTLSHAFGSVFICAILGILEISLSFDNAVINAKYLSQMNLRWRRRFLTWGMVVAVLGIRLVLPVLIVGTIARINPWNAIVMAAMDPVQYATIVKLAHVPVAGFGGAFLLMVALRYFFDPKKHHHWLRIIEFPMAQVGRLSFIELILTASTVFAFSWLLHDPIKQRSLLIAAAAGLATFLVVDSVSSLLKKAATTPNFCGLHRASLGLFVYLEVLDASFSFDGVVGAFAISDNLFVISIGLGIGAMFVRSLTMLFVDRGTLTEFADLENGAFYAIAALGLIMLLNTLVPVPEIVTGSVGASLIGLAFWSSLRRNRAKSRATHPTGLISKKSPR
jgi:hypothetical protein